MCKYCCHNSLVLYCTDKDLPCTHGRQTGPAPRALRTCQPLPWPPTRTAKHRSTPKALVPSQDGRERQEEEEEEDLSLALQLLIENRKETLLLLFVYKKRSVANAASLTKKEKIP